MPDDRLFHPRLRQSQKVASLSYLERCVWEDMILGADNFGVLPYRASKIRADNLSFSRRETDQTIESAMKAVVTAGLFLAFEHQGELFLCDPLWEDFQHVKYPRKTYLPAPPPAIFSRLCASSQLLLKKFHPMCKSSIYKVVSLPKNLEKSSRFTRADHRLTANGKRLTANGKRLTAREGGAGGGGSKTDPSPPPTDRHPYRPILEHHRSLYRKKFGRELVVMWSRDGARLKPVVAVHGVETTKELITEFFQIADDWIAQSDYGVGAFLASVNKLVTEQARGPQRSLSERLWAEAQAEKRESTRPRESRE